MPLSRKHQEFTAEMKTKLGVSPYVREGFARIAMERSTNRSNTANDLGLMGFKRNEIRKAVRQAEYSLKK